VSKYQAVVAVSVSGHTLLMSANPELQDKLLVNKYADPYFIAHGPLSFLVDTNAEQYIPDRPGLWVFEAQDAEYIALADKEGLHPVTLRFEGVKVARLPASAYAVLWGAILDSDNDTAPKSTQNAQDCASEGV
jgi:hypothetical protein